MTERRPNQPVVQTETNSRSVVRRLAPYGALALAGAAGIWLLTGGVGKNPDNTAYNSPAAPAETATPTTGSASASPEASANPAETATPTTGSASASPEASANPSSSPSEAPYKIIKQDPIPYGETVTLPANTVIVGDIFEINGQPWADSDSQTGLITILDQQAGVTTNPNFGAYYTTVENAQQAQALADADKPVTETLGCIPGQGCKIVDELHYPGTSQYTMSLNAAASENPSPSPSN